MFARELIIFANAARFGGALGLQLCECVAKARCRYKELLAARNFGEEFRFTLGWVRAKLNAVKRFFRSLLHSGVQSPINNVTVDLEDDDVDLWS